MIRVPLLVALLVAPAIGGCSKERTEVAKTEAAKPSAATASTGTVNAEGVRTIAIEAGLDGYVPDTIPGKPGEKLNLVFTRTVEGECLSELKAPDGKLVPLPMNAPVAIAVTVPADGEVRFACGMDMFSGVIVAR